MHLLPVHGAGAAPSGATRSTATTAGAPLGCPALISVATVGHATLPILGPASILRTKERVSATTDAECDESGNASGPASCWRSCTRCRRTRRERRGCGVVISGSSVWCASVGVVVLEEFSEKPIVRISHQIFQTEAQTCESNCGRRKVIMTMLLYYAVKIRTGRTLGRRGRERSGFPSLLREVRNVSNIEAI